MRGIWYYKGSLEVTWSPIRWRERELGWLERLTIIFLDGNVDITNVNVINTLKLQLTLTTVCGERKQTEKKC